MRKFFIILCVVMCSVCVKGQKLGDYMEIDGVPGFVFYLDETGEHGLVMSMWPIMAGWEKIQTKSLRKEGILTEEHMKKLSLPKEKKIKISNKEMKKYYSDLSKLLGDDGEENRKIIEEYCNNNNLPLSIFKGQAFAASLGEGWFIPGDNEVTKFAEFLLGGVGEKFLSTTEKIFTTLNVQYNNPLAKCTIGWMITGSQKGLLSSTIKHDTGFRILSAVTKGSILKKEGVKIYLEIYDSTTNGTPILDAHPLVRTCAVHKF